MIEVPPVQNAYFCTSTSLVCCRVCFVVDSVHTITFIAYRSGLCEIHVGEVSGIQGRLYTPEYAVGVDSSDSWSSSLYAFRSSAARWAHLDNVKTLLEHFPISIVSHAPESTHLLSGPTSLSGVDGATNERSAQI